MSKKIVFILLLIVSVLFVSSCSGTKIQTVSEEVEANEIIDVLREHGIAATKIAAGEGEKAVFEIYISGGDEEFGAAIQLMEDHCIPQPMPPSVESTGIVSSLQVEKSQQLRRTKIGIESLLRDLPGATCVTVNIVPPEERSLSLTPHKSRATVLLKHKNEDFGLKVDQIARIVAPAVPGLTVDNVHVTLTKQPLRPLPDLNRGRTMRRIFWVSGIGLTTILLFVGLAAYLRTRKTDDESDEEYEELENKEPDQIEESDDGFDYALLNEGENEIPLTNEESTDPEADEDAAG